jgi:hypothetical protein
MAALVIALPFIRYLRQVAAEERHVAAQRALASRLWEEERLHVRIGMNITRGLGWLIKEHRARMQAQRDGACIVIVILVFLFLGWRKKRGIFTFHTS